MDVVLTSKGLAAIQAAAPGHVAAVRATFIDRLSAQDLATSTRLSTPSSTGSTTRPAARTLTDASTPRVWRRTSVPL